MATIEISKLNAELETYLENQEGKREVSIVIIFQIYFIMQESIKNQTNPIIQKMAYLEAKQNAINDCLAIIKQNDD